MPEEVEASMWQRVLNKQPKAIVSLTLLGVFGLIFLIAFGYDAANTAASKDFGVAFIEEDEVAFPGWSLVVDGRSSYFEFTECKLCHFKIQNENCVNDVSALSPTLIMRNDQGQPTEVQFNGDGAQKAELSTESYIYCRWEETGHDASLHIWNGQHYSSTQKPQGEVIVVLEKNQSTWVPIRRVSTHFSDGRKIVDYISLTPDQYPAPNNHFRFYYATFLSTVYRQNSPEDNKQNFWSFLGEVGGTAFLFYCLYTGIMAILTMFIFKDSRSGYQQL